MRTNASAQPDRLRGDCSVDGTVVSEFPGSPESDSEPGGSDEGTGKKVDQLFVAGNASPKK